MKQAFNIGLLILAALCLLAGCGVRQEAKSALTGTWEGSTELSLLGEGINEPTNLTGTVFFLFSEDETGVMEMDFGTDVPAVTQNFSFSIDGDQLTLETDEQTMVYTFSVNGDSLVLDGRADFTLTRVP